MKKVVLYDKFKGNPHKIKYVKQLLHKNNKNVIRNLDPQQQCPTKKTSPKRFSQPITLFQPVVTMSIFAANNIMKECKNYIFS